MKKIVLLFLISFFGVLVFLNISQAASWDTTTLHTSGDVGRDNSIVVNDSGKVYISYYDFTNTSLRYAYTTDTGWSSNAIDNSASVGSKNSIDIDTVGKPRISYYESSGSNALKYVYAHFFTGLWQIMTLESSVSGLSDTSIALNKNLSNYPNIAFIDLSNNLKFGRRGGAWYSEVVDAGSFRNPALALGNSNEPHISYEDWSLNYLKYATNIYDFSSHSWYTETVDNQANGIKISSIKTDSSNRPRISYSGYDGGLYLGASNDLKYAKKKSNGSWEIELVDGVEGTDNYATYNSLIIDNGDNPHIAYNGDNLVKYAKKVGDEWEIDTVDSGKEFEDVSLDLDLNGIPHISYYNATDKDLKYATISDSTSPTIFTLTPSVSATDVSRSTNISFQIDDTDTGVDSSTLDVNIEGTSAIANGSFQDGFDGTITYDNAGGYDVVINPDTDFDYQQLVEVDVSVSDMADNDLSSDWTFATVRRSSTTDPSSDDTSSEDDSSGDDSSSDDSSEDDSSSNPDDIPQDNYSGTDRVEIYDIEPRILTTSGPGEPTRLQAYARNTTDGENKLLQSDITTLFPSAYTGGAGIVALDSSNNGVKDQFAIFAINQGGPQVRVMGLRSNGSTIVKGQQFVFQAPGDSPTTSSIRDGLSLTAGDFDFDGYVDDIATCLTGDYSPHVKIYKNLNNIDNWTLINEFDIKTEDDQTLGPTGCNLGTFQYDTGADEILVTPNHGPADPNVYIYNTQGTLKKQFQAYDDPIQEGLTASGVWNRILTTPNNGSSHIMTFDKLGERKNFWWAYQNQVRGNFKNIPGDIDLDGKYEILISPIGANGPQVLSYETSSKWRTFPNFFAFNDETLRNGVGIAVIENWHGVN